MKSYPGLYSKSVRAATRYFKNVKAAPNELARALLAVKIETYRVGWMMGYQAGHTSAGKS